MGAESRGSDPVPLDVLCLGGGEDVRDGLRAPTYSDVLEKRNELLVVLSVYLCEFDAA